MRRRIVTSVLWSAAILILASGCSSNPTAPSPNFQTTAIATH